MKKSKIAITPLQNRRKSTLIATTTMVLVLMLGWIGPRASADSVVCGIMAITFTTGGIFQGEASINADGTRIAFVSDRDLAGGNADGNREIFLYNTTSNSVTQITHATGGDNVEPSINADGTRIAFASNRDLTGSNADGNQEIFLYDTGTNSFTQLTNTTGGVSGFPSINGNGTRIAFESNNDLTGGNADGNFEIFLYDTTNNSFTQVTNTTGGFDTTSAASINADGTRIAFVSTRDLTGGNADGNFEIFLYDTTSNSFTQVTNTTGGSNFQPSINGIGTRIALVSDRDLTGANADGNQEIFLYDTVTNSFTQVTNTTGGFSNTQPSINADGTRIAFESTRDLTGGNADGNEEVFLFDTTTNSFKQVTNTTGGGNFQPAINANGTRIAFASNRDLTGGNADLNDEIFLASCLSAPCPLGQGYWKNHPGAWPVTTLLLGSQTYTQTELLRILNTPVGTGKNADASLILADQLIAAKLNLANGSNPTPVAATISAADTLLSSFTGKLPYKVKPSNPTGQQMTVLAALMDQYNNGLLTPGCAP